MKKRINLLKTQKRFIHVEKIFRKLKITIFYIFMVFLAVYLLFFYFLAKQKQKIDELTLQKNIHLEFFIKNKDVEAKFVYFRNKQKQLQDILKEDVNFHPYYNLLNESLKTVSNPAKLDSVSIDKQKLVEFGVSFDSFDGLINFLRYAESEEFLKDFSQLSLVSFNKNSITSTKNNYNLKFSGKFININEN